MLLLLLLILILLLFCAPRKSYRRIGLLFTHNLNGCGSVISEICPEMHTLAKMAEMAINRQNRQTINKNSNEMAKGPFAKWRFWRKWRIRRKWQKWRLIAKIAKL